jgi:hypothetical protein
MVTAGVEVVTESGLLKAAEPVGGVFVTGPRPVA